MSVVINGCLMQRTTLEAWKALQSKLSERELQIYQIVESCGQEGIAIHEIEQRFDWRNCSVSPRIRGLT